MLATLVKGLFWLGWLLILLAFPVAVVLLYLDLLSSWEELLVVSMIAIGLPFIGVVLIFGFCGVAAILGPDLSACLLDDEREFASTAPDAVVILIHGTFAPDAEWVKKDSKMVQRLRCDLDTFKIAFCRFQWSGNVARWFNNSHLDRYAASQRLSLLLDAIEARFADSHIFLVAHSHGGNVALYAANANPARSSLAGIVTMGTPFIEVAPRKIEDDPLIWLSCEEVATLLWIALLLISWIGSLTLLFAGFYCLTSSGYLMMAVGIVSLLLSFLLGSWYLESDGTETVWDNGRYIETRRRYRIAKWVLQMRTDWSAALLNFVTSFAKQKQEKLIAKLDARAPSRAPMLFQRTRQPDEALRALARWLPAISAFSRFLSSEVTSTAFIVIVSILCLGGAVAAGVWVPISFFRENDFSFIGLVGCLWMGTAVGGLTFAVLTIGSLLGGFVLVPIWMIVRAPMAWPQLLAYGSGDLWAVYFTRTSVAPEPRLKNAQVTVKPYDFDGVAGMKHSAFYDDDGVIKDIAEWMRTKLDGKPN
jgi:pimeloyl-ACP methyl ester carboxylesterase